MTWDAVVVGAGPNGLVGANHLADKGWDVLLLEAQPEVGGAVRSDEAVHPGYVHDTFSAFYPLAAASETIRGFGLERHGLEWTHAPAVLGHPLSDGSWAMLHRDRDDTARGLEAQHAGDGAAWLELCDVWDRIGDEVVSALLAPFPPVRAGLRALTRLRSVGGIDFVRTMLMPVTELSRGRFGGEAPGVLLAGNAGHADVPLDAPLSGFLGIFLAMLGQHGGFPVPVGGAGRLTQALADRFTSLGGEIRCDAEVVQVVTDRGRAVGVRTADGEVHHARRAVIADVSAPALYGSMLAPEDLPPRVHRAMGSFVLDPGTVKVDWALDGPVPWTQPPPVAPGTVHVADSVEQMERALAEVAGHRIPADPFLLCGQMTTTDPTRSPAGTESLWAYTHVPQEVEGDNGPDGLTGRWDTSECERFADRMQARIEHHAPELASRIVARRVLGPHEMQARDANLLGGAVNGGSSQLHQQLVFRPVPGLGRAETPVKGLYLGSAAAHPGGGVHGAPGMNAARAAIAHARLRPWAR